MNRKIRISFIGFKGGHRKTCGSKSCIGKSRKKSCVDKYGVDNPMKSEKVIKKQKENILKKWGGDHFMKNDMVRNKFKETMLENWGVEWAQQSREIKEKSNKTWMNNPTKEETYKKISLKNKSKTFEEKRIIEEKKKKTISENFGSYDNFVEYRKEKIKESSFLKYGTDHHFKSEEVISKRIESYKNKITDKILKDLPQKIKYIDRIKNENLTDSYYIMRCSECESEFEITKQLFVNRKQSNKEICIKCNPILSGTSNKEMEVYEYIKSIYNGEVINRYVLDNIEVDIYLQDLKIGFEFNGLYWHSNEYKERLYHINKTNHFKSNEIDLIHIWEDDWDFKKDIIKSIIKGKIGEIENKIYARKCEVKEINDNSLIRNFLEKNHLQGFVGSKIKLGLFYKSELVCLMTFGNLRKSLGQKSKIGHYELLRLCNKLDTVVVGGASKLLKYFKRNYEYESIISYADHSRSFGDVYYKLGFEFSSKSQPNYYYIVDGIRRHRFKIGRAHV